MIAANSLVITGGRLGRVLRADRAGGADGWLVTIQQPEPGDGYLPHWTPASALSVAVVGQTVCPWPRRLCPCGLAHLSAVEMDALRGHRG